MRRALSAHLSLFSMWYLFLRESAWCLGSRGDPIPKSAKNAQKCGAVWFIAIIMWRKRRKGREGGERAASARVIIIIISCSSDLQPPSSLLPGTSRNITKTNRQTWPRKRSTVASWAPLFPHKTMRIKLLSSQFLRLSRKKRNISSWWPGCGSYIGRNRCKWVLGWKTFLEAEETTGINTKLIQPLVCDNTKMHLIFKKISFYPDWLCKLLEFVEERSVFGR
jgi:hypothetical protein